MIMQYNKYHENQYDEVVENQHDIMAQNPYDIIECYFYRKGPEKKKPFLYKQNKFVSFLHDI